jgi:DNA polymerase (family 10)
VTVFTGPRAPITNAAVARVFARIAELLEVKGGDGAAKAPTYRRASRSVEACPEDLSVLHRGGRLREIPGVGEALARKIAEMVETGRMSYFDRLTSEIPSGVLDLLRVPGIGVSTAGLVWRELGVTGVDQLEEACRSGALRRLPGMGPKKEEIIQAGIAAFRREATRFPLGLARPVGEALVQGLTLVSGVVNVSLAGSVRRWRETAGNLNVVVATDDPRAVAEAFAAFPEVEDILSQEIRQGPRGPEGAMRASLHYGLTAELRLVPPRLFGVSLAYYTGSVEHNLWLGARAAARGLVYDERGLTTLESDSPRPAGSADGDPETEEDLYRILGLALVPPELREGEGQPEVGPGRLLAPGDIRGDLHVHSDWSDGLASVSAMADAARGRGYDYLAICDHTKSRAMTGGLDEKRVLAQIDEIERINAEAEDGFRLLTGTEVDILPDGRLDLPDSALAQLDVVTASIHSKLKQPAAEITERLVSAAKNQNVDVLAHPPGRLIGRRAASELDLEGVLDVASRCGTMLEINAYPDRLDLRDVDARRAAEAGCRLTISTDAHHSRGLDDMAYGVATARRAGLGAADVANTRSLKDLKALISRGT